MKFTRFIALISAAVLCSCTGKIDTGGDDVPPVPPFETLVLRASTTVIEADGSDAVQLAVLADGEPVTEGVRLYDGLTNMPLDLPSMTFTTTTPGNYYFWAAYGTKHTEMIQIRAVDFELPDLPADPDPENTSFVKRVLLTQFTGTGCGYCPGMITILRNIFADEDYSSRLVHTAAHTYSSSDPAYFEQRIDQAFGVIGYPTLVVDMCLSTGDYTRENMVRQMIDEAYERTEVKAGIAATTRYEGNTLVVLTSVKAAQTSEYRVAAWVLEDGIEGRQTNNFPDLWTGDFDIHDNCLRYADGRNTILDYTGFTLGTLESGQTAEYVFSIDFKESWVAENCHVVVFVTVPDENGKYSVNNVIDMPLNGTYPFEYAAAE